MIRWLLSQKSPLFVFMSPGSPAALRDQDPTALLAGPQGFALASNMSGSHEGWEPDAQLCASVSPSATCGRAGGGGGGGWAGAEGGTEGAGLSSCGMPAPYPSPSLPPCLHPRGTGSGPRFLSTLYVQRRCKPPALPLMGKSHSLPSAAPKGWGGDGAGKYGKTLQTQATRRVQTR